MTRKAISVLTAALLGGQAAMFSGLAVAQAEPKPNSFWWPEQLDLSPLRDHDASSNPYGEDFDYAEAFAKLDVDAVKADTVSYTHLTLPTIYSV